MWLRAQSCKPICSWLYVSYCTLQHEPVAQDLTPHVYSLTAPCLLVVARNMFACKLVTGALVALCSVKLQRIGLRLMSPACSAPSLEWRSTDALHRAQHARNIQDLGYGCRVQHYSADTPATQWKRPPAAKNVAVARSRHTEGSVCTAGKHSSKLFCGRMPGAAVRPSMSRMPWTPAAAITVDRHDTQQG